VIKTLTSLHAASHFYSHRGFSPVRKRFLQSPEPFQRFSAAVFRIARLEEPLKRFWFFQNGLCSPGWSHGEN